MKNFLLIILIALSFCAYSQKTISIGSINGGSVAGYGLEGTDTLNVDTSNIAAKSFVNDKFGNLQLNSIPIIDGDGNLKEVRGSSALYFNNGIISKSSNDSLILRPTLVSTRQGLSVSSVNPSSISISNSGHDSVESRIDLVNFLNPQLGLFAVASQLEFRRTGTLSSKQSITNDPVLSKIHVLSINNNLIPPPKENDFTTSPTLLLESWNSRGVPTVLFERRNHLYVAGDSVATLHFQGNPNNFGSNGGEASIDARMNPDYTYGTVANRGIDIVFNTQDSISGHLLFPTLTVKSKTRTVQLNNYPNTRNDITASNPINFLYTNSDGVILSSPIVNGIYNEFYYADAGGVGMSITKKENTVSMVVSSGAVAHNTVSIPNPSAALFGTNIEFYSTDASGTYNNIVTCPTSAIVDGGVAASSTTLLPNETINLKCHRSGTSTYIWVVTNRY